MIFYNTIKNASKGFDVYQPGATSPLLINNSAFENCEYGVFVNGKSFEVKNCTFDDNFIAVKAENLHGTSKINHSVFTNNMGGADLHGQSGALTEISSCEFITNVSSSTTIGVLLEEHTAQITCSDFKNYFYSILLLNDGFLDMAENAHNNIENSFTGIGNGGVRCGFNIVNGKNNFANNDNDISIGVNQFSDLDAPITDNNPAEIDVSGNTMRYCASGCYPQPNLPQNFFGNFYIMITIGNNIVFPYNPYYGDPFDPCIGTPSNPSLIPEIAMLNNLSSLRVINTGDGEQEIMAVIGEAGLMITNSNDPQEILDDELAYSMLLQVAQSMTSDYSNLTSDEKKILKIVISMQERALAQIYAQEILPFDFANGGEPSQEIMDFEDLIISVQDALGTPVDTLGFETHALYDLRRVHAYRQGGFYPQALDILTNTPDQVKSNILDKWLYWNCICQNESDYFTGVIEQSQFIDSNIYCHQTYLPRVMQDNFDINTLIQNQDEPYSLEVYPNPTRDFVYFRTDKLTGPDELIKVALYDANGVKLQSYKIEASYLQRVDIGKYPKGAYVLEVSYNQKSYTAKFVIN